MPIIIGIDPGINGAVACLNDLGVLETAHLPTVGRDKRRVIDAGALSHWIAERDATHAFIEQVWAMQPLTKEGEVERRAGTASSFKLGMGYGACIAAIQCAGLDPAFVTPRAWKNGLGLTFPTGTPVKEKKNASRKLASKLWPQHQSQFMLVKDEHRAEAALIAEFGRRKTHGPHG